MEEAKAKLRDKSVRLFTYLRELTQLRSKVVYDIADYEEVLWLDEIPNDSGSFTLLSVPDPENPTHDGWIKIIKPKRNAPPSPGPLLQPWIVEGALQKSSETPTLKSELVTVEKDKTTGSENTIVKQLTDFPDIISAWNGYLEDSWRAWAAEDLRLIEQEEIYKKAFSIYQKQEKLGEAYEVVLGFGFFTKATPKLNIRRHLLTTGVSIKFDAKRGTITFAAPIDGTKIELEQEMVDVDERPTHEVANGIDRQIQEMGEEIWDKVKIQDILKSWIHASSSIGRYLESMRPSSTNSEIPTVMFAPALVLRKKSERNLLRVFQEIVDQLKNGVEIPPGVARAVGYIEDISAEDRDSDSIPFRDNPDVSASIGEVYFPLSANKEQIEIARAIEGNQGVVVQGPPGTGKSQTIANLVCHLLALGKRVLVTSHTPRALKVLRDKFPKEISALCVSVLGEDMESMKALEDSVQGITDNYNLRNPRASREKIKGLEAELVEVRSSGANIRRQLKDIREQETKKFSKGDYSGTLAEIAKSNRRLKEQFGWFEVQSKDDDRPPVNQDEMNLILRNRRELSCVTAEELAEELPSPLELIPADHLEKLIEAESALSQERNEHESTEIKELKKFFAQDYDLERIEEIKRKLSSLVGTLEKIRTYPYDWTEKLIAQVLSDRDRGWRELSRITEQNLDALGLYDNVVFDANVTGLEQSDLLVAKGDAEALNTHFSKGGSLGLGPFKAKAVKEAAYIIENVRINGKRVRAAEETLLLYKWLDCSTRVKHMESLWAEVGETILGNMSVKIAELHDLIEPLKLSFLALDLSNSLRKELPGDLKLDWTNPEQLGKIKSAFIHEELSKKVTEINNNILATVKSLSRKYPNSSSVLRIVKSLQDRNLGDYRTQSSHLIKLRGLKDIQSRQDALLVKLQDKCPELTLRIRFGNLPEDLETKLEQFERAWWWSHVKSWIEFMSDSKSEKALIAAAEANLKSEKDILKRLASMKAWEFCFERMTEFQRQSLIAWSKAVKRIGKGTGKHANKHRKDARESMQHCRGAIPAWIMPIYRVAETIKPGTEAFDVVIVDESSQSGPEALFLHYLAKKIVVVGDDKQISPDTWLDQNTVQSLREKLISDIPHNGRIGVNDSFFDLAEIRFGSNIQLREHFRCMPEIIQFSNNLCYRSEPLIPLKQFGSSRLSPSVTTNFIRSGYQQGSTGKMWNPPEARALVDKVKELTSDDRYAGKTFGIISLLGEVQSHQISKMLVDEIGPEEMERRALVCGDAYAFQGDERDIILLSMVSAPTPGKSIGVLSKEKDEARFNVAASRAKEQMWLFHSVELSDLSPHCCRYKLLEYCLSPKVVQLDLGGVKVDDLRMMARNADRAVMKAPHPFDSWFEVDVFFKIHDRGFRVIPQFEVAGRRIDLLVEGMRGRLAVECDGEHWHGPEQYEADMARQRDLERCGFRFWRLRESAFNIDEEIAMRSLWETLESINGVSTTISIQSESNSSISNVMSEDDPSGSDESDSAEDDSDGIENEAEKRPQGYRSPDTSEMRNLLLQIVEQEGEIVARAAYKKVCEKLGIRRLGHKLESTFNRIVGHAIGSGSLARLEKNENRSATDRILRKMNESAPQVTTADPTQSALIGTVDSSNQATVPTNGQDLTVELVRNVVSWNKAARKMTNSYEVRLLGRLESAGYFLSRNRTLDSAMVADAQSAVKRAIELGFDPKKSYS